jgi:hypothetical protein
MSFFEKYQKYKQKYLQLNSLKFDNINNTFISNSYNSNLNDNNYIYKYQKYKQKYLQLQTGGHNQ